MSTWNDEHQEEHLAGFEPTALPVPTELGTHVGHASRRELFYGDTQLAIEKHTMKGAEFDAPGVADIRNHLARFGADAANERMLERLAAIAAGTLEATEYDVRFLTHERRELQRYRARGWSTGIPTDDEVRHRLWNTEHTCALEDYGVNAERFPLYLEDFDDR